MPSSTPRWDELEETDMTLKDVLSFKFTLITSGGEGPEVCPLSEVSAPPVISSVLLRNIFTLARINY